MPNRDDAGVEFERLARLAPRPTDIAGTGLSLVFLADLVVKHLASAGVLATSELIERIALAGPVLNEVLNFLRADGRIEVRSRAGLDAQLRYGLTDKGHAAATDAMNRGGYVGPAPIPLDDYVAMVRKQSVHAQPVSRDAVLRAFRGMVIDDDLLDRLGPAVNSHRAMFLYGRAGSGKTYTARGSRRRSRAWCWCRTRSWCTRP